ncbi:hypothetical protein FRC00_001301 [Tulasnella sp. 408]|nr:hypothetical protein FRC00_001301 [Tulasnella sp. 408]
MDISRAVSVSGLEDDDSDIDGIRLEDEDLAEAPNPVVDVPSTESPIRAPSVVSMQLHPDDSDNSIKLNRKKTKTRKVYDTPQSSMKGDFFALPLNVMSEILGHLHPLDLLSLARTSKTLRSHIMSKVLVSRLTNVWKKVLRAVRPITPECPKDQSEPQWAALLFTRDCSVRTAFFHHMPPVRKAAAIGTHSQMCGAPQSDRVEWALRLRGCHDCFETNAAAEAYPDVDDLDDILDLIPYKERWYSFYRGRQSLEKLYYSADIKRMVRFWTGYQLRIDYGIQGAHDEFLQFQEVRKDEVEERLEAAEELEEWENEMANQLTKERADLYVGDHWEDAKPVLEQMVAEERLSRARLERQPILDERKGIAISRYATFKKTYDASPDNLLPDDSVFVDIPMIDATIESDGDDALPTMFDSVFDQLSDYLDEWRRERRVDLATMLIEAQEVPNGPRQDPAVAETEGILLLATSIFACCTTTGAQQQNLHWFETLGDHVNGAGHGKWLGSPRIRALKCIKVVPMWLAHVRALVRAAGLNPNTATQRDMDERDARFYCKDCSPKRLGGTMARSWRNCVLHMGYHGTNNTKLKGYQLLSTEARAEIKAREIAISTWQAIDWNQVAISLQGVAGDLKGSMVKLEAPPAQPSARASNPKAAARTSKAIASRYPATGSPDTTVKRLRCKLCPNSNREFATLGLVDHVVKKAAKRPLMRYWRHAHMLEAGVHLKLTGDEAKSINEPYRPRPIEGHF